MGCSVGLFPLSIIPRVPCEFFVFQMARIVLHLIKHLKHGSVQLNISL